VPVEKSLSVAEELTIYHALEHKDALLDALSVTDELLLDLAQVSQIDSAGLQLLILLKKEAQRAGKSVRFVAPSPAVSNVIELCNLAAEFSDPPPFLAGAAS